jgi:WD40 repeat protein
MADLTRDGRVALTAHENGTVEVWDAATGHRLGKPSGPPNTFLWTARLTPDGQTVLIGAGRDQDGELIFWDRAAGRPARPPLAHESKIVRMAISSDGKMILTATRTGKIRLFDATGNQPRYTVEQPGNITGLHFSPDDRLFVTCSQNGNLVCTWEVSTGKRLRTMTHPDRPTGGSVSPDGRLCLTGCYDGLARLWQLDTGELLGPPRVQAGSVSGCCFHPDGKSYLTGTREQTLQRWDIALGKPLGPALKLDDEINNIVIASNSRVLIQQLTLPTAYLYQTPAPVAGDPARIKLAIEVATSRERDATDTTRPLSPADWLSRRQELQRSGGDPFAPAP